MDGKAFRPDGKTAAALIPPAFGLAGVNLHTWTGWGSVTQAERRGAISRGGTRRVRKCKKRSRLDYAENLLLFISTNSRFLCHNR
jgi:hypothetical protein